MPREFTQDNFETEVLKASAAGPVLVDFWAPWCGPCRMMGPVIDNLHAEIDGALSGAPTSAAPVRARVGKLNVDEYSEIASQFGIMSIPTFIVFKNGKPAAQAAGVQGIDQLKTLVK